MGAAVTMRSIIGAEAPGRMHDYVILGGGSSGCTLAARLSENPRASVLLVEAGKDVTAETAPADVLASYPGRAYFNPDFTWPGLNVLLGGASTNDPENRKRARYEQARILGGGSSINGLIANRGAPTDYDGWEEMGATGWNFASVLPYFRKLERDLNFSGEYHGKDGPITIRRYPVEDWAGFVKIVAEVLGKRGLPLVPDQNGKWEDGVMPVATSIDENDRRVSCAMAYLTPAVRARKNLTIRTETYVRRILFEGTRATGAEIARGDQTETVHGRELILTCGAIHSAGRADAQRRRRAGRACQTQHSVVAALPGVGRNLIEHPSVSVSCYLGRDGRLPISNAITRRRRCASPRACPAARPATCASRCWRARAGTRSAGASARSISSSTRPIRKGRSRLRSADPRDEPLVDFRMLSDRRDLERLRNAFRFVAEIAASPELDGMRTQDLPDQLFRPRARRLGAVGCATRCRWACLPRCWKRCRCCAAG